MAIAVEEGAADRRNAINTPIQGSAATHDARPQLGRTLELAVLGRGPLGDGVPVSLNKIGTEVDLRTPVIV